MSSHMPFIGRLHFAEYLGLLASLAFVCVEAFVRVVTLALPQPIINLFYRASRRIFHHLTATSHRSRSNKQSIVRELEQATDFLEICKIFGYTAEEHIVQTKDGYLLGLHRLAWKRGEEGQRVNSGPNSIQKKVIFCMHGLLMNSEVWVCLTDKQRCLPFQLVEQGYDVWFGNNRGNKYSKKSTKYAPTDINFWSFSIDQFAFHDIPDSIDYILQTTKQPSLSYIGFSQGTAQAFASLSVHPTLNDKVDVFIALAPAMAPPGLASGLVNSLAKASPYFLFLVFGRKALLGSATMWQTILYPPIFVRFVDMGVTFLFGWHNRNMDPQQKLAAYPHLYSFTSTKSVVHWFQIIGNGKLQMYDDEISGPLSISDTSKYYKVAKFPTRNIRTPIVLIYGGSDSLVDISVMLKELPHHAEIKEVPHYEHLDFLWARDVHEQVFPDVFAALDKHAHGTGSQGPILDPTSPMPQNSYAASSRSGSSTAHTSSAGDEIQGVRQHTQLVTPPKNTQRSPSSTSGIPVSTGSSQPGSSTATPTTNSATASEWWSAKDTHANATPIAHHIKNKPQSSRDENDQGLTLSGAGQPESLGHVPNSADHRAPSVTRKTLNSRTDGSVSKQIPYAQSAHGSGNKSRSRTSSPTATTTAAAAAAANSTPTMASGPSTTTTTAETQPVEMINKENGSAQHKGNDGASKKKHKKRGKDHQQHAKMSLTTTST